MAAAVPRVLGHILQQLQALSEGRTHCASAPIRPTPSDGSYVSVYDKIPFWEVIKMVLEHPFASEIPGALWGLPLATIVAHAPWLVLLGYPRCASGSERRRRGQLRFPSNLKELTWGTVTRLFWTLAQYQDTKRTRQDLKLFLCDPDCPLNTPGFPVAALVKHINFYFSHDTLFDDPTPPSPVAPAFKIYFVLSLAHIARYMPGIINAMAARLAWDVAASATTRQLEGPLVDALVRIGGGGSPWRVAEPPRNSTCAICCEALEPALDLPRCFAGHALHPGCYAAGLRAREDSVTFGCPTCRAPLPSISEGEGEEEEEEEPPVHKKTRLRNECVPCAEPACTGFGTTACAACPPENRWCVEHTGVGGDGKLACRHHGTPLRTPKVCGHCTELATGECSRCFKDFCGKHRERGGRCASCVGEAGPPRCDPCKAAGRAVCPHTGIVTCAGCAMFLPQVRAAERPTDLYGYDAFSTLFVHAPECGICAAVAHIGPRRVFGPNAAFHVCPTGIRAGQVTRCAAAVCALPPTARCDARLYALAVPLPCRPVCATSLLCGMCGCVCNFCGNTFCLDAMRGQRCVACDTGAARASQWCAEPGCAAFGPPLARDINTLSYRCPSHCLIGLPPRCATCNRTAVFLFRNSLCAACAGVPLRFTIEVCRNSPCSTERRRKSLRIVFDSVHGKCCAHTSICHLCGRPAERMASHYCTSCSSWWCESCPASEATNQCIKCAYRTNPVAGATARNGTSIVCTWCFVERPGTHFPWGRAVCNTCLGRPDDVFVKNCAFSRGGKCLHGHYGGEGATCTRALTRCRGCAALLDAGVMNMRLYCAACAEVGIREEAPVPARLTPEQVAVARAGPWRAYAALLARFGWTPVHRDTLPLLSSAIACARVSFAETPLAVWVAPPCATVQEEAAPRGSAAPVRSVHDWRRRERSRRVFHADEEGAEEEEEEEEVEDLEIDIDQVDEESMGGGWDWDLAIQISRAGSPPGRQRGLLL